MVLDPLLYAFVNAIQHMPKSKTFELWSSLGWFTQDYTDHGWPEDWFTEGVDGDFFEQKIAWGMAFPGAGMTPLVESTEREVSATGHSWWRTAGWRPQKKLHGLFQDFGRSMGLSDIVEHFDVEHRFQKQGERECEAAGRRVADLQVVSTAFYLHSPVLCDYMLSRILLPDLYLIIH